MLNMKSVRLKTKKVETSDFDISHFPDFAS